MEIISRDKYFDFLSRRKLALGISCALVLISILSIAIRGLNFGIDFTGGTLVEVGYRDGIAIESVRDVLSESSHADAIVQHFGSTKDVLIRLPATGQGTDQGNAAQLSSDIMSALREPFAEELVEEATDSVQQCVSNGAVTDCQVQMRRVEFVGPQVGDELANQGGLAMIYALIGILLYVAWRFEWRFAVGSVVALVHDVIITVGLFSLFQVEFSLSVLAAVLAVIGYSLNDTIVVYDRIRENYRKMRKSDSIKIINNSINQTLPRTILTSLTTMFVVVALLIFGGEVIRGFSIALFIGVIVGTYSSIYVASPVLVILKVTREDLMPVEKEGADLDQQP